MDEDLFIPISALNQYTFCPRRCWYMHVAHEFFDNAHTVEGDFAARSADPVKRTGGGSVAGTERLPLFHSLRPDR